jgi:uncharacterized protein YecA (UPF0149 family)
VPKRKITRVSDQSKGKLELSCEDPEMRPEPISPEQREEVIVHTRHIVPKVGRNDLCPCGSGKKCKKCCGGATVN